MKTILLLFAFPLITGSIFAAEMTIKVNAFPATHDYNDTVYLAGSMNGWNPEDENYMLTLNNDSGSYEISLEGDGTIDFKFTRGGWDRVEKGNACVEIGNRTATFGVDTVYKGDIVNWADQCGNNQPYQTDEANVSILYDDFYIPQFDRTRRIWVYLPPEYENSDARYPVIYMHDGQNLFDTQTSFAGEWQIDESLNQLIEDGLPASIIIGIDNGGNYRIEELTPWTNPNYGGGEGEKYIDFIVHTLKPHIDSTLRTLPDRENTGIFGSSLGGLISFYGALTYPEIFSKIGVFSPSFWYSDSCYTYAAEHQKTEDMNFYLLAGGREGSGGQVVNDCKRMVDTLKISGYADDKIQFTSKDDGTHSEWFWRREFPDAYRWLWGYEMLPASLQKIQMEIFPNPATDSIFIQLNNVHEDYKVTILNLSGRSVYQSNHSGSACQISTNQLKNGSYIIQCTGADFQLTSKIIIQK